MNKILISLLTVGVVSAAAVYGTQAFFSDTETSTGNTFTAGSIDLSLGSTFSSNNNANGVGGSNPLLADNNGRALYNFTDLKPGDFGRATFDLQVTSNEAYLCAKATNDSMLENTIVDPEAEAGDVTDPDGELQNYLQFAIFHDVNGNGLYDGGEPLNVNQLGDSNGFTATEVAAAGWISAADTSAPNTWLAPLSSIQPATTYHAGFMYCFGNFDLSGNCTGAIGGNDAQTDSISGSIQFQAIQTRNNPGFVCSSLNVQ